MDEPPIRNDAMGKDPGQSSSESTALIEYRVPPAPVPTFFATDPPPLAAKTIEAAPGLEPPVGDASAMRAAATIDEPPVIDAVVMSESPSIAPPMTEAAPPISPATEPPASSEPPSVPGAAAAAPRSRRFALLAGAVALAASIGAIAGSLGYAEIQRYLIGAATSAHTEAPEDIRVLKDTVAQLRANMKALADNVAAMRVSITASNSTVNGQLTKISEALDRAERHPAAAPAVPPAPAEITGTVSPQTAGEAKPAAKPPIVDGWVIRKVYDGAALIEGRYGIVEVEPGMNLPGLGRIQDIKRQDGHWVVVTAKGLILPVR
jgi:hypothetical protein